MQRLTQLSSAPYVCASCVRRLANAPYRNSVVRGWTKKNNGFRAASSLSLGRPFLRTPKAPSATTKSLRNNAYSTAVSGKPFRVAIIGSGPAGFYTAYRLMSKIQNAVVDMYEQLPVPYGLVRFGVAPDHPDVKNCEEKFEEVAESPRFNYIGNVKVGHDVDLASMTPHYDAILFSYGASQDKKLGIPGEDLQGVVSAREFVGWYNGLPQFQHLAPNLEAGDQAVIIGQGNVAIDVARILLTPVDVLRSTDITEQAIQTLDRSRIKSVKVVGRRGPLQAACTVKEVREMMHIDQVAFHSIDPSFYPESLKKLPRIQKRVGEVLLKGTGISPDSAEKSWALEFLKAPKTMNASGGNQLSSVTFTNQAFVPDTDRFSKEARVVPTEDESTIDAALAFRSVGYKSTAIPGLAELGIPFDNKLGIIPNDAYGRAMTPSTGPGELTAGHLAGLYCAGWVKRGPTGVIASTMEDAFTSADIIAQDWNSGVPFLNFSERGGAGSSGLGWEGIKDQVVAKGVRPLSWKDWKVIDEAERARGKNVGKSREKFGSVEEMLKILDA